MILRQSMKIHMTNFLFLCLGLSLMVPTLSIATSKKKVEAGIKILLGSLGIFSSGLILSNIAQTAHRRLANPLYHGPRSICAHLDEILSILGHNKSLATFILFTFGASSALVYSAAQDLSLDSYELQEN